VKTEPNATFLNCRINNKYNNSLIAYLYDSFEYTTSQLLWPLAQVLHKIKFHYLHSSHKQLIWQFQVWHLSNSPFFTLILTTVLQIVLQSYHPNSQASPAIAVSTINSEHCLSHVIHTFKYTVWLSFFQWRHRMWRIYVTYKCNLYFIKLLYTLFMCGSLKNFYALQPHLQFLLEWHFNLKQLHDKKLSKLKLKKYPKENVRPTYHVLS